MTGSLNMTCRAPAKVNLFLGVSPRITQGRHLLTTVLTTIDLADVLSFSFDPDRERLVTVEVHSAPGIGPLRLPVEQNIVYRAVGALEEACGRRLEGRLDIVIEKHVPFEAGLAGGSSDAAATLRVLAGLWGMGPLDAPVLAAARSLGSDVAFFLYGGCALMGAAGEELLRRLPQPALDLVLVKPACGVSTAAAYAAFDDDPPPLPQTEPLLRILEEPGATPQRVAAALANNLYPAACSLLPELAALVAELSAQPGIHAALLTGSGSTVFGVCEDAQVAAGLARRFSQQGFWSQACATGASLV